MADQEQTAGAVRERLLQAFDRRQIEMVGRFIHDDQIGLQGNAKGKQQFSQLPGLGSALFNKFAGREPNLLTTVMIFPRIFEGWSRTSSIIRQEDTRSISCGR